MFTGIVTDIGKVRAIEKRGDTRIVVDSGFATMTIGASVACSGVCLTVVDQGCGWFAADVSAETLSRTTLGGWKVGEKINLERALRAGDELGGHFVLGHVDGVAVIAGREPEGDSVRFLIDAPSDLARFIAVKGSVALDGVALTVNEVEGRRFSVNIIPHTARVTTLGAWMPGTKVNLEVDVLARYLERLAQEGEGR